MGETNIFGEPLDKSNEPHEPNIFEQAEAEAPKVDMSHEPNIFEQEAQKEPEEPVESAPESISQPEPEPEPVVAAAPAEAPIPGEGEHDIIQNHPTETPTPEKKKKSKKWLIILIVAILLIGGGIAAYFLLFKKNDAGQAEHAKKTPAPEALTTVAKLDVDYNAGLITADEYFKQLTYSEFDSSKLDAKYNADENAVTNASGVDYAIDFVNNHLSEISLEARKEFARHYYLSDVTFGKEEETATTRNILAAEDDGPKRVETYLHRLDSVTASSGNHFLIWYTTSGDDAITDEQAEQLASDLETNLVQYTEMTGYEYGFESILSNKRNGGYKEAVNRLLKNKNISNSMITEAMNVYVLDTKSSKTLATYYALGCGKDSNSTCDFGMTLGQLADMIDEDGAVAWPHVVVNTAALKGDDSGSKGSQVINHELFHHYQNKIICNTRDSYRYAQCPGSDSYYYKEALANLSSVKVSPQERGSFLSDWSYIYATRSSAGLRYIASDSGDRGYGQYPYFYSYDLLVSDGYKRLTEAHKQTDPYQYLQDRTTRDDLIEVINDAAYRAISKDYANASLIQDRSGVNFENDGDYSFDLDVKINAGATHYYTLGKNWSLDFKSTNDHITGFLVGKKGETWSTINTASTSVDTKSTDYADYSEVYFVITNAHLINDGEYHLKFELQDAPGTITFNNKYDNYAVDYTMHLKMGDVKVDAKGSGVVDEKHQREYLKTEITAVMGLQFVEETYSDFYNGVDYYQNPELALGYDVDDIINLFRGGSSNDKPEWLKHNHASHTIDIDFIAQKLTTADQAKKISDGHYRLKMTSAELNDLLNTSVITDENTEVDYQIINGEVEIDVYIDKYGRITKLDYDLHSLLSGADEFTYSMTLSKYNEAGSVMIPPSIVANAVEQKTSN